MFFPLGVDPEAYQRVVQNKNSKRVSLEKRMSEIKKAMNEYINCLADHPRISFSGMMYYGHLNSEYIKLKKEYDTMSLNDNVTNEPMKLRSRSKAKSQANKEPPKQILNENTRELRKRKYVNYKV